MKKRIFLVAMIVLSMTATQQVQAQSILKALGNVVLAAADGLLNGNSYCYGRGPMVPCREGYRYYNLGTRLPSGFYMKDVGDGFYEVSAPDGRYIETLANIEPDLTRLFTEHRVTKYRIVKFDYLKMYHSTFYEVVTDRGNFRVSAKGNIYKIR